MKSRYVKITGKMIAVIAVLAMLCAAIIFVLPSAAASGETISSDGDKFVLTEKEYGKTDGFVYTATVRFTRGDAAGLVFGASDNEHYWVFNIDRAANRVKLMYFAMDCDETKVVDLISDYFIGNDKMTASEKALVEPKVKTIDKIQLKVVVTPEDDGVYAEFYADNIMRFGVDNVIKLDELEKLPEGVTYEGGKLGYNTYNAEATFDDVYDAASDYSYYTELYRQQYHFSQYSHWNNDPNGLVYYDGWYHLYYQHHPFSNYWSDMYWGHARSRDLLHWEHLPICLFPDRDFGTGDGFMWSGSAMVYRKGMSDAIDALDWYPQGAGTGLIAFYTRDGGRQDQMIMSSDDGGMIWTKRKLIPQALATGDIAKTDCRDPKVFPIKQSENGKTELWGMALTGMATYDIWFLKSSDLLNWSNAGGFKADGVKVECPDVVTLTADDGTPHTVMTFTGRTYAVGELEYDETTGKISFKSQTGTTTSRSGEIDFKTMDFGPDSYATQTFYIDDRSSEFYGKTVSLSWFSGVPGAPESIESGLLANARKVWNGGGMTIPVEWGLKKAGGDYVLTQTPITKTSAAFGEMKTELYKGTGVAVDADGENILSAVNSHCIEIDARISNPDNAPIAIRINVGENEYTEIGWNETDGYYVDRSHTADAGLSMNNYAAKYVSHIVGAAGEQSFYILSDNGGVEVFCDDFSVPFYVLTFASPYSKGASFVSGGAVTVDMTVNAIASAWNTAGDTDDTILYIDTDNIELDMTLMPVKQIMAYSTSGAEIEWSIESGVGAVRLEKTATGAKISALDTGAAVIVVKSATVEKRINVKVAAGTADCDPVFESGGIISGEWYMTGDGIIGDQPSGDGFIISSTSGNDFVYVARVGFSGAAAAVVFRATSDMSDYLIANYDNNGKVVKLWSPRGEIARANMDIDPSDVVFKIIANGTSVKIEVNGIQVINVTLTEEEPTEGLFGLNVCAGRATFETVALIVSDYTYGGDGALNIGGEIAQTITALYNMTNGNTKVSSQLYSTNGRILVISREYFTTLGASGKYTFKAVGDKTSFVFDVNVSQLPKTDFADVTIDKGCNAVVFVGGAEITAVILNGKTLAADGYSVRNGTLTVYAQNLSVGDNLLEVPDLLDITITVKAIPSTAVRVSTGESSESYVGLIVGIAVPVAVIVIALAVLLILNKKKHIFGKNKNKGNGDPIEPSTDGLDFAGNKEDENGGND